MIGKKIIKKPENEINIENILKESLNYYKTHKTFYSRRRLPMDPIFSIFPRNSLDFTDGYIFIQNNEEISNIKRLLNGERFVNKNVLIKGISGIGKSYSIYQIVIEIRNGLFETRNPHYIERNKPREDPSSANNNNRCVYIPDYGNWFKYENEREANFLFIFSIFIAYEINNDKFVSIWWKKDFIKSIKKLSNFNNKCNTSGKNKRSRKNSKKKFTFKNIVLFLNDLSRYNKIKKLNFFVFFDQHTPITTELINSKKSKFPYNLPEIISSLTTCDMVVVSISEGKNQPLVKFVNNNQNSWTTYSIDIGFQYNEFLEWKAFYISKFRNILWFKNNFLESKICYYTNMLPGELNYFIQGENKFKNGEELFENYYSIRYREYKKDLEIVYNKLTNEQRVLFERTMALVELKLPIDNEKILSFSQFMVRQYLPEEPCFHKKGGYSIIRAKSPMASIVLKEKLTEVYQSFLMEFIEKIFSVGYNYYSRDVCFNAVRSYFINKIQLDGHFKLTTQFTESKLEFPKIEHLVIDLIRTVHIYDTFFNDDEIDWNYSFIMIPHSNHISFKKEMEFYIWDAVYLRFFIVQISFKLLNDRSTYITNANKNIWSQVFKKKGYNHDMVHYLYLGPEFSNSIFYNYISSFQQISETFPLFKYFSNEWINIPR
ncbi:hypothetical protein ACTA71_005473 [Dictyostelium dimigraforme]